MDRDSAVALLKLRMGNNQNPNLDSYIVTEMQHVQRTLLEEGTFKPWFLETVDNTLTCTANTRSMSLPSDFIEEVETQAFWRFGTAGDDTTLTEMTKGDADELDYLYGADTGTPKAYSLFGETEIHLWPMPDAVYTFKLAYLAFDTVLSSNVENNWLKYAPDLLIAETGAIIAGQYNIDQKAEARFQRAALTAMKRLMTRDSARREANHDRVRGGA